MLRNGQATVPAGADFAAVTVGAFHTCGLRSSGALQCFGLNTDGQCTPPGAPTVTLVTTGNGFACALFSTHRVQCWGTNT